MIKQLFNPYLKIPMDKWGNILHDNCCTFEEIENYIFDGKIVIDKLVRFDHRMYLDITIFEKDCNYKASMFFTEFVDMMKKTTIVNGEISGKFTFMQRGTAIGLRYIGEDNNES